MISILLTEFLGTAFLVAIVVGSGIMGETLAQGNEAIALLTNSLATGLGLFVLIQCLGSISGAHFNPIVSLVEAFSGRLKSKKFFAYLGAQFSGAVLGIFITHAMFNQEILQISQKVRNTPSLWFSEVIASFGLICTIALSGRKNPDYVPMSVAAFITSAYWFTSSTSFANPAVTFARMFTNTFGGIAPSGVIPFVIAQLVGAILAYFILPKNNGSF